MKALERSELLASLRSTLAQREPREPLWIFAYGSLMWNPDFSWDARHVATIRGYHRSFRLWSRNTRGTPERPGLVLTLECGGSCRGLIFRVARDTIDTSLERLWKREMSFAAYRPRWLNCSVGDESIRALTFTVNRDCPSYAGRIPVEVTVEALSHAAGRYGPAHEYLFRTLETLKQHGIRDMSVEKLASLVRRRLSSRIGAGSAWEASPST